MIAFSGACSLFGLYLQSRCARYNKPGHLSFFALSQLTYPSLSVLFDLGIAIKCFGVGVSYLVVIGDLMPKITESLAPNALPLFLERNFWISVLMATVVAPLSYLRHLDSLRYALMAALTSVAYLAVLVIEHFVKGDIPPELKGPVRYVTPLLPSAMLSTFPLFVFLYTCHQNMFSLVNELRDRSQANINRVILAAIGTAMSLYIFVGSSGYLTFGDNVQGNIIVMYPARLLSTIGRIAIVILVTLSYPLQCHPARASVNHIVHYISVRRIEIESRANLVSLHIQRTASGLFRAFSGRRERGGNELLVRGSGYLSTDELSFDQLSALVDSDSILPKTKGPVVVELPTKKFFILTTLIVVCSYLVAMRVQSLEHVLGFVGATGSTSILFILPGIFGYKLIGSEHPVFDEEDDSEGALFGMPQAHVSKKDLALKYMAGGLTIWGVLVMVLCLYSVLFLGAGH